MNDVIYDPIKFNIPQGAIKNNEGKVFRILVNDSLKDLHINLVIYNNYDSTHTTKYEMNRKNKFDDYWVYECEIHPLETGIYYYFFETYINNEVRFISRYNWEACITENIIPWQITVYNSNFNTPEWTKGRTMYQIFPDRFNKNINYLPPKPVNEDERFIHESWYDIPFSPIDTPFYSAKDFFMGNLNGIMDMSDYLRSLSIDIIYLNPIFESAENHRYSTANYFNIDPYLGTNNIFDSMVEKFNSIGIKFILDGVFSHTGSDSIYFNKNSNYDSIGAYNSIESPYYPWFFFSNYPDKYESWWGFDNLPTVNKNNRNYIDFICKKDEGVLNYWQKKGIGGWRFDVLDEFPDSFIDEMRDSIKSFNEDSLMIGEVWEDASNKESYGVKRRYLLGDQVDSVMNYPWRNAIIDLVKTKDVILFTRRISEIINNYPTPSIDTLMNLLSSHDIERILTCLGCDISSVPYEKTKDYRLDEYNYKHGKKLLKYAVFIQFTLPGIPSIYYGDEIGMQGFRDPYNRLAFDYKNIDEEILNLYRKISLFRRENRESFISGFEFVDIGKMYFSYRRNNLLCIVNLDKKAVIIDSIDNGIQVYGEKKIFFTDYGTVIPPESTSIIDLNNIYTKDFTSLRSIFDDETLFIRSINLRKDNIIY